MILYFADRHLNIIGQATTHLPEGVRVIKDLKTEDVDTGVSIFECRIPFDRKTREKVEEWTEVGNYILRSSDNENEFYNILDSEIDTKKQEVYIYAEDDGLDLINDVAEAYEADQPYPISSYIERFAAGAGWEIGVNEVEGLTKKLSWDSEQTASARLLSIAEGFNNCELSYSFEINGLQISKKYINIYEKRGIDTGIQLRLNKEIDGIVTTKSITNLATALKATGGTPADADAPITLLGYEYDNGDFYVDGAVLKSRKALEKWSRYLWKGDESLQSGGHIVKPFSYATTSQAVLCEKAIEKLKTICDMEVNYDVDISKFPENVKVGDRVNIVDDAGELYLSSRVLILETSVSDMTKKAVLGEHIIKKDDISQKVYDLAEQFASIAQSRVLYTWIAYADDENGTNITTDPTGKEFIGIAANRTEETVDVSDPSVFSWSRIKGEEGKSVSSVDNYYLTTDKNTDVTVQDPENLEDEGWLLNSIDKLTRDKPYLWNFERTHYSDGSYTDSTPALIGNFAKDGVGISEIQEWYGLSSDENTPPEDDEWSQDLPTMTAELRFLWNYEVIIYTDGEEVSTDPLIIGVYGDKGDQGDPGDPGDSLQVKYLNSATTPTITNNDVSGWSDTVPTPEKGKRTYMTQKLKSETNWSTPIQISAEDGTTPTISISQNGYWIINGEETDTKAQGETPNITVGANGNWFVDGKDTGIKAQGEQGKDGADIEYVYYRSQTAVSNLSAPSYTGSTLSNGWNKSPQGITETYKYEYVSVRNKSAGSSSWSAFSTPIIWSKWGEKGTDGDGIEYKYYLSNSATKPTYSASNTKWTDEPTGVSETNMYEYVVQITHHGNGTTTTSNVALWSKWGATGQQGPQGDPGAPAVAYSMTANLYAILKTSSGKYIPENITLYGRSQSGTDKIEEYAGRFEIEYTSDGTQYTTGYPTAGSTPKDETSVTYKIPANITALRCTMYLAGGTDTKIDELTIPVVSDGLDGDGYTVILSNDNHTFAGSTTAAVAGYATCKVFAYKGIQLMNTSIGTITGAPTGMTPSITTNNSQYSEFKVSVNTNMSTKNGTLTIPITVDDKVFEKQFTYSLALQGVKGDPGVGISSVTEYYARSSSSTSAPADGSFGTSVPALDATYKYLWNYEVISYTGGKAATTTPKTVIGVFGADGKGVKSTTVTYQSSTSGTSAPTGTWLTYIPSVADGSYLWTKTVITYTDNSTSTSYSVAKMGNKGDPGKGIKSTSVTYQASTSGTTTPTGTWLTYIPSVSASQYLWTKTVITYSDDSTSTSYSVGMMGATGKGVKSTAVTYQSSTSGTSAPTGTWLTYIPSVAQGNYLWTRTVITYTDDSTSTSYSVSSIGIDGTNGKDGQSFYAYSESTASTLYKEATMSRGSTTTFESGITVSVKFKNGNTHATPYFFVTNVGATSYVAMAVNGKPISATNPYYWSAGDVLTLMYDGTYWNIVDVAATRSRLTDDGLVVGDYSGSTLGSNVLIKSDAIDIRGGTNGETVYASYGASTIYLGKNSTSSTINLCNSTATMKYANDSFWGDSFVIDGPTLLDLTADHAVRMITQYEKDSVNAQANIYGSSKTYDNYGNLNPKGYVFLEALTGNNYQSTLTLSKDYVNLAATAPDGYASIDLQPSKNAVVVTGTLAVDALALFGDFGNSGDILAGKNLEATGYLKVGDVNNTRANLKTWGYAFVGSDTTYPGLVRPNGVDTGYVRTPQSGILPYKTGGSGSVGTSTWPFSNGYFTNLYVNGAAVTASTAILSEGWKDVTLTSDFSADTTPRYRKVHKTIEIQGTVKPTKSLTGGTSHVKIFTLPSGYRPSRQITQVCSGSGLNRWLMIIKDDGTVNFSRYNNGAGYIDASTSTSLLFHTQFFVD